MLFSSHAELEIDEKAIKTLIKKHKEDIESLEFFISKILRGRIIHSLEESPTLYEIIAFDAKLKQIIAHRIYDQNAILLLPADDTSEKTLTIQETLDQMHIMEDLEAAAIRKEMEDGRHSISIKYQVDGYGGQYDCIPLSIEPTYISLSNYTINFNASQRCIGEVRNNSYGPVKFKSVEIDANAGFVSTSVVDVWTTVLETGVFNIIHCHLVDRNESVPILVVSMLDNEAAADHHEFGVDVTGQILRYKMLVKNNEINSILYNTGVTIEELKFNEIKVSNNVMMQAIIPEQYPDQAIVVKLIGIPNCMTTSSDLKKLEKLHATKPENYSLTECKMRYFDELPGLIDVKMISDDNCNSLFEGEHLFSIPI
jgi:hypothetical protein